MNEESQAQHCGDTCGVVASMAAVFSQYVPPEQRMAEAIAAVQSGTMSQRAAATTFDLARPTLQRRLNEVAQMGHPTETQSSTEVSGDRDSVGKDRTRPDRQRVHKELRALAKTHGVTHAGEIPVWKAGLGQIYQAITEAGHAVPEELIPASKKKTATQSHDTKQQRVPANDPLAVIPSWGEQGDSFDRYDSEIDSGDAVRDEVCQQVQQSNRPADFKRAILLLRELDDICTEAWYRRHPEPWGHDDWAHVCSEVSTVYSLVRQRAQEECEDALLARTAIETRATVVP